MSLKYSNTKSFIIQSFILAAVLCSPSAGSDIIKQVADGVTLTQITSDNAAAPLLTNVLSIDMGNKDLQLRAVLGKDVILTDDIYKGKENVASMVERTNAIAGINADFFAMEWGGDPLGVCIINGELISEPARNRAAMAITKDNKVFFDIPTPSASLTCSDGTSIKLDGINKPRASGQLIAYTSAFGAKVQTKFAVTYVRCTSTDLPISASKPVKLTVTEIFQGIVDGDIQPGTVLLQGGGEVAKNLNERVKVGDVLTARFDINSPSGYDWSTVDQSISGGPWLVKDGVEFVDGEAEGFGSDMTVTSHPRTAIGLTADNKLLMVTVDGRQVISKGLNMADLATCMRKLGAVTAINLDGGGSTTLSIRGFVVNSPSGGVERYVADGLLLFSKKKEAESIKDPGITGIGDAIVAGDTANLSAVIGADKTPVTDKDLSKVIWGSKSGMGFVDQTGRYYPRKIKVGDVCYAYGPGVAKKRVRIFAGPTSQITAKLTPDANDKLKALLEITSTDKLDNPTADRPILLNIKGGIADTGALTTDDKGKYNIIITWDASATEQSVEVKIDDITATTTPIVVNNTSLVIVK